jgi:DNA-binding CsgD family transcriptional regulator
MSRDPGERLLATALDSLMRLGRSPLAVAFSVDERDLAAVTMMRCAPGHDRHEAAVLVSRLRQLEPVDPFSPRRAMACRAVVMSAVDVGGLEPYARSMHGQRLRTHGYGAPVVLYLWRARRIVAGVTLLRERDSPPFDALTVHLLGELQPLLEQAFGLAAAEPNRPSSMLAAGLTAREEEVTRLIAGGASNAEIARKLNVSEATVKAHLTKIYTKLGVRSRTQLAVVMSDAS